MASVMCMPPNLHLASSEHYCDVGLEDGEY